MDNKITKKRLSNFLSYEWILMIVIVVALIIGWEFIYSATSVKLSTGQQFKYYYDLETHSGTNDVYHLVKDKFSFEVLSLNREDINPELDLLAVRLTGQDGDVIFTNSIEKKDSQNNNLPVRAKEVIDKFSVYDYNSLLRDACDYIGTRFLLDAVTYPLMDTSSTDKEVLAQRNKEDISITRLAQKVNAVNVQNLDNAKIEKYFADRTVRDNRFHTKEQKENGKLQEIARIKSLCTEISDFYRLLTCDVNGLFYTYTKHTQENLNSTNNQYQEKVDSEIANGRENAVYGLNLGKLTFSSTNSHKKSVSDYIKIKDTATADGVVLSVFNFKNYQLDTQFETIAFVNQIVRVFSDFLD